jgi:alcohol/geraniol dehydrogenase (NADP+)
LRDPGEIKAEAEHFDLILSTVDVNLDWNDYVQTLKSRGRLHDVGATLEPVDLNVFPMIAGRLSISASPAVFGKAARIAVPKAGMPVGLISSRYLSRGDVDERMSR